MIKKWFRKQIRQSPALYGRIREAKYRLWQYPGLNKLTPPPAEWKQLKHIVNASHPRDRNPPAGTFPHILVFTPRAWSVHTVRDALVAHSLRLRGAKVSIYTCGGRLPICNIASHHTAPPMPCAFCRTYNHNIFATLGFSPHQAMTFITRREMADIQQTVKDLSPHQFAQFEDNGLPIGQLVQTSVRWFINSGEIGQDKLAINTYHRFLISGAINGRVLTRLLEQTKPDIIYLLNGLFMEEQTLIHLAHIRGIEYVTHESGFFPETEVFARNDIAPYFNSSTTWPRFRDKPLTEQESHQLDAYLNDRQRGGQSVRQYYPQMQEKINDIYHRLNLNPNQPTLTAFTNILWDSAVLDRHRIFDGMIEWLHATIQSVSKQPDTQLIIRIHPAEIRLEMRETRQKVASELQKLFPHLPANVRLVLPKSPISSYSLMQISQTGLVYTSTVGLEMALMGKPVIVSGKTHYGDKGFVLLPQSLSEYLSLLQKINRLSSPSPEQIELARRYAYFFFFRLMVQFNLVTPLEKGRLRLNLKELAELRPGRNAGLDIICRGILQNKPFLNQE